MTGHLLIAGGNIGATEAGKAAIFSRFSTLCGGKEGKVLILATASGEPIDSGADTVENLRAAGVGAATVLPLTELPEVLAQGWTDRADEALLPYLEGVTGVWFTGGDQLRTARLLLNPDGSDTPVLSAIRAVLDRGGVIGGTSAGAAIMSRTMLVRGDDAGALTLPVCTDPAVYVDREESPEQLLLSRGLGFLPSGLVDQHFNRRPRLQRLMAALEVSGEAMGYGISEDTALEVDLETMAMKVHGSAYVMQVSRTPVGMTIRKFTAADKAVQ